VQTNDGGYLFGGYSWSEISGDKSRPNNNAINFCDYWIVKTDASGNKIWDKVYGGNLNDQLDVIKKTEDGGYVLAGYSWSDPGGDKSQPNNGPNHTSDYWIVKIDAIGNLKWEKIFGGNDRENDFGTIQQTSDKGYFIAGTSYSNISANKTENNFGIEQSWVLKMDSAGNQEWDKTIITNGHDEAAMAILSVDGSIVMANYSNGGIGGYKTQMNHDTSIYQTYDFWIVKLVSPVAPLALYSAGLNNICAGRCVNFTNLSMNGNTYQWMFPGANTASSTAVNPQGICYPTAGNYSVTLIATNNFGSDTITLPNYITVNPAPVSFSITNSGNTLIAPPGLGTYQWYYYNTLIQGANSNTYTATQSGTYGVVVF
jgi:PKD repeat protein